MSISLEKIDELRTRANISYREAREILEKTDGDIVEALIYLEENEKSFMNSFNDKGEKVLNKLKSVIKSGNVTKIVLKKEDEVIMNIPITAGAIGAVLAPTLTALGVGTALLTSCTIEIYKEDGEVINLNNYAEDAMDKARNFTNKTVNKMKNSGQNVKDTANDIKDDIDEKVEDIKEDMNEKMEDIKEDLKK